MACPRRPRRPAPHPTAGASARPRLPRAPARRPRRPTAAIALAGLFKRGLQRIDRAGRRNTGATLLIGPCSRMKRVSSPRAGRPVYGWSGGWCRRAPRARPGDGSRSSQPAASQIGRADLHRAGAQREGRRDAAPVGDGAGGDHWHAHRVHHLRQQGIQARLGMDVIGQEHAAMAAGLGSLGDDGVHAARVQPARFRDRGGRGQDHGAAALRAPAGPRAAGRNGS